MAKAFDIYTIDGPYADLEGCRKWWPWPCTEVTSPILVLRLVS